VTSPFPVNFGDCGVTLANREGLGDLDLVVFAFFRYTKGVEPLCDFSAKIYSVFEALKECVSRDRFDCCDVSLGLLGVLTDFRDRVEVFVRWGLAFAADTGFGVLIWSSTLVPNGMNEDCAIAVEAVSCVSVNFPGVCPRICLSLIGVQAVGLLPVRTWRRP
jgi:hypothetical protein